jgi:hypothetical protein
MISMSLQKERLFPGYNDQQLLRTSRGRLCISNSVGEKEQQLAVEHGSVPTR